MYNFKSLYSNSLSTSDGGFILPFDDYLVKIDSHGDTLWTVMFNENASYSGINAITTNTREEIMVVGNAILKKQESRTVGRYVQLNSKDVEKWNWIAVVSADGELLSLNRIGDRMYGMCQNILSFDSNLSGVFYDSGLDLEVDIPKFRSPPLMEIVTFDTGGNVHWESNFEFPSGLGNYPLINPVCFQKHPSFHDRILFVYNLRDSELPILDLFDPRTYTKPRRAGYQEILERTAQDTLLLYLTLLDEKGISGQAMQIDSYEDLHQFRLDGIYRLGKRFWFCWEKNEDWLTFIENRLIKGVRLSEDGYQKITNLTNHLYFANWDSLGRFVSKQIIDLNIDFSKYRSFIFDCFQKLPDGTFLMAGELDVKRRNTEHHDQDLFLMRFDRHQLIWFQHYGWTERNEYFHELFLSGSDIVITGVSEPRHSYDSKCFIMKIGPIN